ncbi:hypothetical protein [Flavobacterium sp. NRK F7]|uniref:hypothetical protein n=1 Tax=Flavobacterium sp. NRK F7 TaxID=2954930 RepID=UPI0020908034|nr:hypothetical protein [Flavobacterium sp. NRK F7]MCO6163964.1 hypothetical protein [Flavobacterium sp. NRK F7]
MKSNFEDDLKKEQYLGEYLDTIYSDVFKDFKIERKLDSISQNNGIDLIISKDELKFNIDEKAQLDYLNLDLPTFAFEISYIKDNLQKLGWLYDKSKITDKYFLITGIFLNDEHDIKKGFKSCKIISVDRAKLILFLKSRGLNFEKILEINHSIRNGTQEKNIFISELDSRLEGKMYYSKNNKAEMPINLVLYLDFLLKTKIAKKVH